MKLYKEAGVLMVNFGGVPYTVTAEDRTVNELTNIIKMAQFRHMTGPHVDMVHTALQTRKRYVAEGKYKD